MDTVTITSEYADQNPHMVSETTMNHYKVTLHYQGRQMTLYFSKGLGLSGEPTADEVLECLFSDSVSVDVSQGFEDWAYDMGLDEDSRRAEKTYNQIVRQTKKLKQLLGDDYQTIAAKVDERVNA